MQEMQETRVPSLGQEAPLEGEMTAHPTILAWEIPWTEEPGRLQSMGSEKSWTQLIDGACTQPRPLPLASPSPFQLSYKRHCIFSAKGLGKISLKSLIHQMWRKTEAGNALAGSLLYSQKAAQCLSNSWVWPLVNEVDGWQDGRMRGQREVRVRPTSRQRASTVIKLWNIFLHLDYRLNAGITDEITEVTQQRRLKKS